MWLKGDTASKKLPKETQRALSLTPGLGSQLTWEQVFEPVCASACYFNVTWACFGLL